MDYGKLRYRRTSVCNELLPCLSSVFVAQRKTMCCSSARSSLFGRCAVSGVRCGVRKGGALAAGWAACRWCSEAILVLKSDTNWCSVNSDTNCSKAIQLAYVAPLSNARVDKLQLDF